MNKELNNFDKTNKVIRQLEEQKTNNITNINWYLKNFLDEFYNYLKKLKLEQTDYETLYERFKENIDSFTPLRNQYIYFLENFMAFNLDNLNISFFTDFFADLEYLTRTQFGSTIPYGLVNFELFLYETLLYTLIIGLKYKKYNFVSRIIYSPYYLRDYSNNERQNLTNLDVSLGSKHINNFLSENNYSNSDYPLGNLLIKRLPTNFSKDNLINADMLCTYATVLHPEKFNKEKWFSNTFPFKENKSYDLFRKLDSKYYFEQIKCLFQVKSEKELKDLILKYDQKFFNIKYGLIHFKCINEYIEIESICKNEY